MSREHSVNCLKSCDFDAGETVELEAGDMDLEAQDVGLSCSKTKAIYEYFLDRYRKDFSDTFITMDDAFEDNELCISLSKSFVKHFYNVLPEPFLVIRIDLRVLPNSVNSKAFLLEKRLELREMLTAEGEDSEEFLEKKFPFPNDFVGGTTFLSCSISLGWIETETPTPIRICLRFFMEKLFADESTMDLAIVAGNGAEIKCHTLIFAAHTPVFNSMLSSQTGMTEAQTKRIELGKNSEEGIRHLVHYLYGMELQPDDLSSDVALELFQLAHKYGLSELEDSLLKLFLGKGVDWFTPDVILELYFYVRNVEVLGKLREHALSLMASIPPQELRSCEEFKKLDKSESVDLSLKLIECLQKPEGDGNENGRRGVKRRRSDSEHDSTAEMKKCNCN